MRKIRHSNTLFDDMYQILWVFTNQFSAFHQREFTDLNFLFRQIHLQSSQFFRANWWKFALMLFISTKSKFLRCSLFLELFCNVKIAGGAFTEKNLLFHSWLTLFKSLFHPFAKFKQTKLPIETSHLLIWSDV